MTHDNTTLPYGERDYRAIFGTTLAIVTSAQMDDIMTLLASHLSFRKGMRISPERVRSCRNDPTFYDWQEVRDTLRSTTWKDGLLLIVQRNFR